MQKSYQDMVLNHLRREKMSVTIYLTSGFQIRGIVLGFDNYVIILESEGKQQMVYKHAVSSVVPLHSINDLFKPAEKSENSEKTETEE